MLSARQDAVIRLEKSLGRPDLTKRSSSMTDSRARGLRSRERSLLLGCPTFYATSGDEVWLEGCAQLAMLTR